MIFPLISIFFSGTRKKLMFMAAAHREMMVGPAATAQASALRKSLDGWFISWQIL